LQLLGREYYHPLEPALIYGSISLHLVASLLRRLHLSSRKPFRPTAHQAAGYILIPFLTLHLWTHRILPSSPEPPINALSPAELGYGFVSHGLRTWPVVSWTTYTALIASGVYHAVFGVPKIISWLRSQPSNATLATPRKQGRRIRLPGIFVALVSVLGIGLARLHSEDPGFSRGMESRVDAMYRTLPWLYR
jgi:hypothetical protein